MEAEFYHQNPRLLRAQGDVFQLSLSSQESWCVSLQEPCSYSDSSKSLWTYAGYRFWNVVQTFIWMKIVEHFRNCIWRMSKTILTKLNTNMILTTIHRRHHELNKLLIFWNISDLKLLRFVLFDQTYWRISPPVQLTFSSSYR